MKSILLTSTALVAFAGAASAEVTWGADAEFGYNEEVEGGFYFDGGLAVATTAGMMMGLEAGIGLDVDINFAENEIDGEPVDGEFGGTFGGTFDNIEISASDFVIFVRNDVSGLYIGDTETASQQHWSGTTNMEQDGFLEVGDVDDGADDGDFVDGVLRADLTFGAVSTSVSYFLADNDIAGDEESDDLNGLRGLQLGVSADLGQFSVGMAYQEEVSDSLVNASDADNSDDGIIGESDLGDDDNGSINEIIGVYASTTFAGASVKLAYAAADTDDGTESSTGIEVSYPVGPVTATVFYSSESDDDIDDNYGIALGYDGGPLDVTVYYHDGNDQEVGIEGSYDVGNGLVVYAGYIDNRAEDLDATETYVAAEYDLGGGASLIAAYGEGSDDYLASEDDGGFGGANDEIGNAYEVNEGATIAISFSF